AQQDSLNAIRGRGVDAAKVLRAYEPDGSLVIEDAGITADAALRNDSSLRDAYDSYLWQVRPAAMGRFGELPGGRFVSRHRRFAVNDLTKQNIGYTPNRGFVAVDP